jgi:hypothetical protein
MKRSSLILAAAIFSIFFAVFVNSQAYGGFEVSPSSYDFGDVDLGTSSTVIFTATNAMDESDCRACHGTSSADRHHNLGYVCGSCHGFPPERDCIVCHQALTIQNIQLQEGSSPDFLITGTPITPFDMYTGDSVYIEVILGQKQFHLEVLA